MIDMVGNEIEVGSTIVLANRASSSCWLDIGRVTALVEDRIYYRKYNRSPWRSDEPKFIDTYTRCRDRLMVVDKDIPEDLDYLLSGDAT